MNGCAGAEAKSSRRGKNRLFTRSGHLRRLTQGAERYKRDSLYLGRAHYKSAEQADRKHHLLGAPSAVLSAVAATSLFAMAALRPELPWVLSTGVVSLAASVLTALQTFHGYQAQAERYRAAGAAYASLRRELDVLLLGLDLGRASLGESTELLTQLIQRFDQIARDAPLIPESAYRKAAQEVREVQSAAEVG